jgi:hypothetical protein
MDKNKKIKSFKKEKEGRLFVSLLNLVHGKKKKKKKKKDILLLSYEKSISFAKSL